LQLPLDTFKATITIFKMHPLFRLPTPPDVTRQPINMSQAPAAYCRERRDLNHPSRPLHDVLHCDCHIDGLNDSCMHLLPLNPTLHQGLHNSTNRNSQESTRFLKLAPKLFITLKITLKLSFIIREREVLRGPITFIFQKYKLPL
jgi:hypothetical protein